MGSDVLGVRAFSIPTVDLSRRATNHPMPVFWARRCALHRRSLVSSFYACIASHEASVRLPKGMDSTTFAISFRVRVLWCDLPPSRSLSTSRTGFCAVN